VAIGSFASIRFFVCIFRGANIEQLSFAAKNFKVFSMILRKVSAVPLFLP